MIQKHFLQRFVAFRGLTLVSTVLACIGIFFILQICGCDPGKSGEELFRENLNRQIGQSIDVWTKLQHEVRSGNDGTTEYIFKTEKGCTWAFVVNGSGTILSWHYLGDAKNCKLKFSWGPF